MAEMNVSQFAKELGVQPALLLEQLQAAGVSRPLAENAALTEQDKTQLLDYLRRAHGANESKGKITLTRKQTTEIRAAGATGKARTIQVEVRKKRVFVQRDAEGIEVQAPVAEAPAAAAMSPVEIEAQRMRDEDDRRQREALERQAQEMREREERLEAEHRRAEEAAAEAVRREEEARREQERVTAMQASQVESAERAQAEWREKYGYGVSYADSAYYQRP
jgi:translation initiation factor IF-2